MFRFEYGTNNVYAQLGFADAHDIPLKAEIVREIDALLRASGVTVAQAAAVFRIAQSDLVLALCGKFEHVRLDELRTWRDQLAGAAGDQVACGPECDAAHMAHLSNVAQASHAAHCPGALVGA